MKIQLNYREMEAFYLYLKGCIVSAPTTVDKEKEYLIAHHIKAVMKRLFKKMADLFHDGYNSIKKHKIKLDEPEILSLYRYFNRYELVPFLFNTREQVYNYFKLNNNLLNIINQTKKYEATYKNNGLYID